jgi:hypothetical protein
MQQELLLAQARVQLLQWRQNMVALAGLANAHKAMKMLAQLLLLWFLKH